MAFSDLCHISNAFKTVENDADQSERIMEENAMVRDLITKILDETGPSDGSSSTQPPEKSISTLPSTSNQYQTDLVNTSFVPPSYNYQDTPYNFTQNDQNGFNFNMQNGFGNNGFVNYESDVSSLLGIEPVGDNTDQVTPEQLNLLRLAAQQIGGAQFSSPKYDEKYYNFFEPNQRNSLPETNIFSTNNFNRPNSLNVESFNSNYDNLHTQRFPNGFTRDQNPDQELLNFLGLNAPLDRSREESVPNLDFKMPMEMNGQYHNEDFNRLQEDRNKMLFNRNFQQMPPNKNFNSDNFYLNGRNLSQNFDFSNQTPVSAPNSMNYKPNGFHPQNEFMQRRDVNPMMPRDFQVNGALSEQRTNFENNMTRDNIQQAALVRQNQELTRQMNVLMRNRPPPNPLNVDVSFLHENAPFNLGLGALLGPNPQVPPPVLPSPMVDLAPFYTMRNVRGAATASSVLHARLDACYEQWRQLERERKRTEARLALAYPGRAVSSSNSIPVPRLPPCPTRVDRLTVDMLREHTKVLTLMGKMETLRASVTVAQCNKKPTKPEDGKITVLKRGQEVTSDRDKGTDPGTFDPSSWREDVKNMTEIAPHQEIENAMLAWRNAVAGVQAARRREMSPHPNRYMRQEPIAALSEAVKQLCICARRARAAMWCDLTLTVALASYTDNPSSTTQPSTATSASERPQSSTQTTPLKPTVQESTNSTSNPSNQSSTKQANNERKEEKPSSESPQSTTKVDTKTENKTQNKQTDKQTDKTQQRRSQNYRKLNQGSYYQKNQRYDNRFMHRPPYYLATGSIN